MGTRRTPGNRADDEGFVGFRRQDMADGAACAASVRMIDVSLIWEGDSSLTNADCTTTDVTAVWTDEAVIKENVEAVS